MSAVAPSIKNMANDILLAFLLKRRQSQASNRQAIRIITASRHRARQIQQQPTARFGERFMELRIDIDSFEAWQRAPSDRLCL